MLRKAREGRVCSASPPYGFRFDASKDGLLVHETEMAVVERIFRMAAEGLGIHAMQNRLLSEDTPTAKGKRLWAPRTIKKMIDNDAYRPHTFEEVSGLVSPEVAARLNSVREYGVQWYNRKKFTERTVSEPDGNGGRRYRKRRTFKWRPREEWVAIPVPAYLPRSLVDQARSMLGELEETCRLAEAELETIALRRERVEELEADRDALLEDMATLVPEALRSLAGEERHKVYRMLRLEVMPVPEGLQVCGALGDTFVLEERHLPLGGKGVGGEGRRRAIAL